MLAPVAHILPLTTVRRERLLPVPGRVVARLDQKVTPLDVVAEANYGHQHALIDVAHTLGVTPEAASRYMQVKVGDLVNKGDVVAQRIGLVPVILRAPDAGRVIVVGGGQILMELGESTYELKAGIPGIVTRQVSERGVEITFNGALVQGVWGNGQVGLGMILPMISSPDDVLTAKQIDVSHRGSILMANYCSDPALLQIAAEQPVRGIILGSIAPALLPQAMLAPFPVIVVDGFGRRPLNGTAFKLLSTNAKREATINAQAYDRQTGARPEIYIPLPINQEPPQPREVEAFAPDQTVRLVRAPHAGAVGTVSALRPGLTSMPSGLRVAAADVKLESGEQVTVPLANLEVLG